MSRNDDRASQFTKGSFATWKFQVLDAMLDDSRVQPGDFSVAYALMQNLNQETMSAFPSQAHLAEKTNMSRRYVALCLSRLRKAGWIKWTRGNRQRANEYEFDKQTVADALARLEQQKMERRKARSSGRDRRRSDVNWSAHQATSLRGTIVPVASGSRVQPNTYIEQASRRKVVP